MQSKGAMLMVVAIFAPLIAVSLFQLLPANGVVWRQNGRW